MKRILLTMGLLLLTNVEADEKKNTHPSNYNSLEYHIEKCNHGNAKSCIEVGLIYDLGSTVKRDVNKTIKFYTKACDLNMSVGCTNVATIYVRNQIHYEKGKDFIEKSSEKSRIFFKKACDKKDSLGCLELAAIYDQGLGVTADIEQSKKYYKKACDYGSIKSCHSLAYLEKDNRYLNKDCNINHQANACLLLGAIYETGHGGVAIDINKSDKLYQKGHNLSKKDCDLNNMTSCILLADIYRHGLIYSNGKISIKKDIKKSLKLYKKACKSIEEGCFNLGTLYYFSGDSSDDAKKGRSLIVQSCNNGYTKACRQLIALKAADAAQRRIWMPELMLGPF